ncbi:MAG: hypothetical protein WAT39_02115 [Planctomycetota bacterium]
MNRPLRCLLLAAAGAPLPAQSFTDFTEVRNPVLPFASVFQLEAGAIGTVADNGDRSVGLDDETSWDGKLWYRDEAFSSRRGTLEAYAGRDGLFGAFTDGKLIGDDTVTRFEVRARPWMFYRDGFYRDGKLAKNGFYDGDDYEGYIGFGREAQGLYIELGPYYRQLGFQRSALTPATFTIPDDYAAYGGRLYLEQSTAQMDRRRGLPREGYVFTLVGEREWNDSRGTFGTTGFATELPSAVWRVRGHLDWYIPASDNACWEIFAQGGWHDETDRLQNTEGQRPLGNQWGDVQARLRLNLGTSATLTPFAIGQYSRLLDETGFASDKEFFFGGGAELYWHWSDALSLHAWYSFVDNENRPSIRVDEDVHGEHMFFLGMVLRLGTKRR